MPAVVQEWLNLVLRWAHVIAAIMWIGDSFLFMWLDSTLERPAPGRPATATGEIWLTHSGGFYEVIKHRTLTTMPGRLYWFMWQSYSTWISGVLLLIVVYGLGARAMLLEADSGLSHAAGFAMVIGLVVAGTVVYEGLCRIPRLRGAVFGLVGLAFIAALAYVASRVFTARAAFLVTGAVLGTIMTANVAHVIIPGQRRMVAATREGRPVDPAPGVKAKQRSTHNHYLTLPVLFTMLSNHFPRFYAHPQAWLVLTLMVVAGAGVKLIMNLRTQTPRLALAGTVASLAAVAWMTAPPAPSPQVLALAAHPPVALSDARAIVELRCVTCHSVRPSNPAFSAPPNGVVLERPEQMNAYADRIVERVVETRTMPLGNLTGMTDAERVTLGAWAWQQHHR
jgi:uncharacterized membrane protein